MTKKIVPQLDSLGYVIGLVIADPSPLEPDTYLIPGGAIDAEPPSVPDGMRAKWNGSGFDFEEIPSPDPVPVPSIDEIKASVWERIKSERDRRFLGGFLCAGHWYHSDPDSKTDHLANKDTARDQIAAGDSWTAPLLDPESGQPIVWKTMDGAFVPLTCQLAFDIVAAGKATRIAHFSAALDHKASMEKSPDPAAYDFSGGWKAIFSG